MITQLTQRRSGQSITVTATSSFTGDVIYHWYLDGVYLGGGSSPNKTFAIAAGDQARVECKDTTDEDYDGAANAPDEPASRRQLQWTRGTSLTAASWRVEEQLDGGSWRTVAVLPVRAERWSYEYLTRRLTSGVYVWRVVPIDSVGDDQTAVVLRTETVIRRPDAPTFTAAWDDIAGQMTISG